MLETLCEWAGRTHSSPSKILFASSAFLFGFGDSAFNTQLLAFFSTQFPHNAEPYFAGEWMNVQWKNLPYALNRIQIGPIQ